MSWFKNPKRLLALILTFVAVATGISSSAVFGRDGVSNDHEFYIKDSGLVCKVPLSKPWQNFTAIFGFSSIVYQESDKDINERAMLAFVVTQFEDAISEENNIEKEFESFRKAKADYIKEEGGIFLGPAESLKGENGIYRVSVRYQLGGQALQDSTYFFQVGKRLVHAKALFSTEDFDPALVEKQTLELLSGVQCRPE